MGTTVTEEAADFHQPAAVVRVAVAGATGYAGRELLTLLARHPHVRVTRLMSSGRDGKPALVVGKSHPTLRGRFAIPIEPLHLGEFDSAQVDLVFLCTPHEVSLEAVPQLLARGLRVIDLSGAFRLQDATAYPRWYGFEHHAAAALEEAVFGLCELNREAIRTARLVANPGCYSTSIILALAPLRREGWLDVAAGIICDSKSGASGAGRGTSDKLHFCEVNESLRAYGLFHHRHVPEMLQALGLEAGGFLFAPHLLPIQRGILSTIYARLAAHRTLAEVAGLFAKFYADSRLVRIYGDGSLPEIQAVAHTNFTDLGFAVDEATRRLVIVSCLDNLGKGAAGQAVQNLNLLYGFAEETALL
jgi:N-acetyl-gamma-glutamyl-phosphate reductase